VAGCGEDKAHARKWNMRGIIKENKEGKTKQKLVKTRKLFQLKF